MSVPRPIAAFAWLACGLLAASTAHAQRVPSLDGVREAHRRLRQRVPELSVKWTDEFQLHAPPEVIRAVEGDRHFPTVTAQTAFKGDRRFYEARFAYARGAAVPAEVVERQAASYDGEITTFLERRSPADGVPFDFASLWVGDELKQLVVDDSYMLFQGWPTSPMLSVLVRGKARPADIPTALADPSYRVEPSLAAADDGTPCVVVESTEDRLWLDPERGLVLRQREWSGGGAFGLAVRLRLGDHREVQPGVWMPRSITRELFADPSRFPDWKGKPYLTETKTVTEILPEVPAGLFTIALQPGTRVGDMTRTPPGASPRPSSAVVYAVPVGSSNLEEILRTATAERLHTEGVLRQGRAQFAWLAAVNLGLVVLLLAAGLWYARRTAPA